MQQILPFQKKNVSNEIIYLPFHTCFNAYFGKLYFFKKKQFK